MVAINTMVKKQADKDTVLAQTRAVKNCLKFVSKCTEDVNEVLFLTRQPKESGLEASSLRLTRFKELTNKFELLPGVWMSKK